MTYQYEVVVATRTREYKYRCNMHSCDIDLSDLHASGHVIKSIMHIGVALVLSLLPTHPLLRRGALSPHARVPCGDATISHPRTYVLMRGRGRVNARGRARRGRDGGGRGGRGRGGRGRGSSGSSPTPKPAVGDTVSVVEKANYGTDERTVGIVSRVLTRSAEHSRGFKVRLQNGVVGRCTQLIERAVSSDTGTTDSSSSGAADSSEAYLASLDLSQPPPGIRLSDSESRRTGGASLCLRDDVHEETRAAFGRRAVGLAGVLACMTSASVAAAGPPMVKTIYTERDTEVLWGPFKGLSDGEIDALEAVSQQPGAGSVLPSGTRVIDLVVGTGPLPARGDEVYCHYKVWADGFRSGPVADWTYLDGRPYDWRLGEPTDRIPMAVDEGVAGMREGGWRRLVVPKAYGDAGLRRINPLKGGGRYTPPRAGFVIQPNSVAYFDLIMVDGGSGRCAQLLNPSGMSADEARKRRSKLCLPDDVRTDGLRLV